MYIAELADSAKPSTLQRRLSSILQAHRLAGYESPTSDAKVRQVMAGIRRVKTAAQKQATPALAHDLRAMLKSCSDDSPLSVRDRALLLVGFGAALRRSEVVALDVEDLELSDRGVMVTLRRSKTDQEGEGRKVAIPGCQTVAAVRRWLEVSGIASGPVFRPVNRHGQISPVRTTDKTVARVVKARRKRLV